MIEYVLGIDPGHHGAIAVLDRDLQLLDILDMPTKPTGQGDRRLVCVHSLLGLLEPYAGRAMAVLEQLGSRRGQSVQSATTQGIGYGITLAVLGAHQIGVRITPPHVWKAKAGLKGKDKAASVALATQLYPAHHAVFTRHDRAEAVLIARSTVLTDGGHVLI